MGEGEGERQRDEIIKLRIITQNELLEFLFVFGHFVDIYLFLEIKPVNFENNKIVIALIVYVII